MQVQESTKWLQVSDPPEYFPKSIFEVTAERPFLRPILPADQEPNFLNLLHLGYDCSVGLTGLYNFDAPKRGVEPAVTKAACDLMETLSDLRFNYLTAIKYKAEVEDWSDIQAGIDKFNARKVWLETFNWEGILIEVTFSESPEVMKVINGHRGQI